MKNLKIDLDDTNKQERKLRTESEIQDWMISYFAELLQIDKSEIDINLPFDSYGLNSENAVIFTGDLEEWLQIRLEPTLLYNYPTINTFTEHLAKDLG